jgi:hypothetical protein
MIQKKAIQMAELTQAHRLKTFPTTGFARFAVPLKLTLNQQINLERKELGAKETMSEQPMRCRIPLAWQLQLEAIAQRTDQSIEQLVYHAIGQYLGQIEKAVIEKPAIEPPASALNEVRQQVLALTARMTALEQAACPESPARSPISLPLVVPLLVEENLSEVEEDDIEDEPDEILYDFLEPHNLES